MEGTSLFSLPEGMQVSHIQITENGLVVEVIATAPSSCCPLCSEASESVHCHYRRVQLFLRTSSHLGSEESASSVQESLLGDPLI